MVNKNDLLSASTFCSIDLELRDAQEEVMLDRLRMIGIVKRSCLAIVVLVMTFVAFASLWKNMSIFYVLAPAAYFTYDLVRTIWSFRLAKKRVLELEELRNEVIQWNESQGTVQKRGDVGPAIR